MFLFCFFFYVLVWNHTEKKSIRMNHYQVILFLTTRFCGSFSRNETNRRIFERRVNKNSSKSQTKQTQEKHSSDILTRNRRGHSHSWATIFEVKKKKHSTTDSNGNSLSSKEWNNGTFNSKLVRIKKRHIFAVCFHNCEAYTLLIHFSIKQNFNKTENENKTEPFSTQNQIHYSYAYGI